MKLEETTIHYKLSSPQREIWFDQMLHPGVPLYNIGGCIKIKGAIDPARFESAVNLLVQRQEALRTVLKPGDDELPILTVLDTLPVTLPHYDFSNKKNPYAYTLRWAKQQLVIPFELYNTPFFQFALIKIDEHCFVCFQKYHHLMVDGWSLSLIPRLLANIFTCLTDGQPLASPPPPFSDFVKNDHDYVQSQRYKDQRLYWLEKYKTLPEPLFKPGNKTADLLPASERHVLSLARPLYNRLIKLAKECHVTTFQLILGALYVYFTRTWQTGELVAGLPALNRSGATFKETVGSFVGVSPARLAFGTDISFKTLIQCIGTELKRNYRYQRFPTSELNRELGLMQMGRKQLFDITISYLKHDYDFTFGPHPVHMDTLMPAYEQAPLVLYIREFSDDQDVDIDFMCNPAYIDAGKINDIQARFLMVLEYGLHHVDQSIATIPLLTEAEKKQLQAWNLGPVSGQTNNQTVVDIFEVQAEKAPHHTAVVFEDQQLSYRELNRRANQLARHLITLGVSVESLVGICITRSLEMVITLLAVLKAGAAYVPLDPDYPGSRLRFMQEDSSLHALVCRGPLPESLADSPVKKICLHNNRRNINACSFQNPPRQKSPRDLAYVIYTSGSTGLPKGVGVNHSALAQHIKYSIHRYKIEPSDTILQFASLNFDTSIEQIFNAICSGARLLLLRTNLLEARAMREIVSREKITVADFPPAYWQQLLQEPDNRSFKTLKLLILGGDALSLQLAQQTRQYLPRHTTLFNAYGPTEATITSTLFQVPHSFQGTYNQKITAIGQPIAHTRIYIMDKNHSPTPPGTPGELCIAGERLARGYLNRPQLTAEKFIITTNQITSQPITIYKTGDLARWLPDGNIEYLGRLDHQVKLRGFRIELSEIEINLTRHRAVKETVVLLSKKEENPRLIAYVTLKPVSGLTAEPVSEDLRCWLKERLPEYMLPASYILLDKLPLTLNGKIDRNALLLLETPEVIKHYQPPRDTIELQMAQIWEDILDVNPVGIDDNFFELGGHSLLAVRLITQIQQQFERQLPMATLFQNATIRQLTGLIRQQTEPMPCSSLITVQADGQKPPLFCVHPAGGNVFCYYELAQHLGKEQPFYGLQACGIEAGQVPDTQVIHMAESYLETLKTMQPRGPYQLAGWSFGGLVAFEMARILKNKGESISLLALLDTVVPSYINDYREPEDDAQFLVNYFADEEIDISLEHLRRLTPDQQLSYAIEQGKQMDLFPANIDQAQAQRFLDVYKTNAKAAKSYQPNSYKDKIRLFHATERPEEIYLDPDLGWQNYATEAVDVIQVPGSHQNMVKSPHVQSLARQLKNYLQ